MPVEKTILVIDDDIDICEYCAQVLGKQGYDVRYRLSAAEGLDAVRAQRPALVILDIMMEEADSGLKLAETLSREASGMPVIMLSSIAEASARVFDTSVLPVSELMEKPIQVSQLINTVERLLAKAAAAT